MAADPLKLDFAVTPTTQHPAAEQDTFEWNWNMEPLLNIYNLIPSQTCGVEAARCFS